MEKVPPDETTNAELHGDSTVAAADSELHGDGTVASADTELHGDSTPAAPTAEADEAAEGNAFPLKD